MHINKLPKEIFSSFVSRRGKLNCIRVCRQWHLVISTTNLFSDLLFKENLDKFNQALAFFQANKYKGKQANQLDLNSCNLPSTIVMQLSKLLPKVNLFKWFEWRSHQEESLDINFLDQIQNANLDSYEAWKNIEVLDIILPTKEALMAAAMLMVTDLSRARTVTVKVRTATMATQNTLFSTMNRVIGYMIIKGISKDSPALTSLDLSNMTLSSQQMELLHSAAPNLQKMHLENMELEDTPELKFLVIVQD